MSLASLELTRKRHPEYRSLIGRHAPEAKMDEEGFHAESQWQEPPRLDGLTLYDIHRQPRPTLDAEGVRIQRPLKLLCSEFRCVICLDYIRNTARIVPCLHRFCFDCIEKSLRLGRKECPICRIAIPSRRSLAPDPNFDSLIATILGPVLKQAFPAVDITDDGTDMPTPPVKSLLQQAIDEKQRKVMTKRSRQEPVREVVEPVQLKLERHAEELVLEDLLLPFIRMSGSTTLRLLERFIKTKLDCDSKVVLIGINREGEEMELDRRLHLKKLSEHLVVKDDGIIHLYYRQQ